MLIFELTTVWALPSLLFPSASRYSIDYLPFDFLLLRLAFEILVTGIWIPVVLCYLSFSSSSSYWSPSSSSILSSSILSLPCTWKWLGLNDAGSIMFIHRSDVGILVSPPHHPLAICEFFIQLISDSQCNIQPQNQPWMRWLFPMIRWSIGYWIVPCS